VKPFCAGSHFKLIAAFNAASFFGTPQGIQKTSTISGVLEPLSRFAYRVKKVTPRPYPTNFHPLELEQVTIQKMSTLKYEMPPDLDLDSLVESDVEKVSSSFLLSLLPRFF
jgi:hypothetical protein